ncbi:MAG: hypothetical protein ETSY2_47125, partial [Candidatus Entotheonella gemina]
MKTSVTKSNSDRPHPSHTFFSKGQEGAFFSQTRENQKPFFHGDSQSAVVQQQAMSVPEESQDLKEEEEVVQGKTVPGETPTQLQDSEGKTASHTDMPDNLRTGLEQLSGVDLSNVRVHYNSSKPAQLNALAYTQGQDIHVSPGQEKHLPHEGWHAVQQMRGRVKPTMQAKGVSINDDADM